MASLSKDLAKLSSVLFFRYIGFFVLGFFVHWHISKTTLLGIRNRVDMNILLRLTYFGLNCVFL